jgi:hypothetical protein
MLDPLRDLNEKYKNPSVTQRMKMDVGKEFRVLDL